jgi:DNA mismatch repair ATPase MutS
MKKMDEVKFQELVMAQFDKMNDQFGVMNKKFDQIDKRFDGQDKKFDQIDQRFSKIDEILIRMENKMDEKFAALFEFRNIQTNTNSVILEKLTDIESKIENLDLKTIYQDTKLSAITKKKFGLVELQE